MCEKFYQKQNLYFNCQIPCDYVPVRSWPLLKAHDVLRGVIESLRQETAA